MHCACCSKYVYGWEWRMQKVLKGGREEREKKGGWSEGVRVKKGTRREDITDVQKET